MDVIFQDVRFAWRMIWRRPTMTSVALASLVVGISLSATVFALLNAVLLRPLPVDNPDELAVVLSVRQDGMNHNFSYPDFVDYRSAQRSFTGMFAVSGQDVTMKHPAGSQIVAAELVSGGYFDILGVRPIYGRGISLEDDQPSAAPVALVSQAVWEDLGGNPDQFTPRTVTLNTHAFSIIGVVAPPYRGMEIGRDARVWVPLHTYPLLAGGESILNRRTVSWITAFGRLAPGATFETAAADLNVIEKAIAGNARRPEVGTLTLESGRQGDSILPRAAASPLMLLLGAAGLVLIVACANVANLLLARATERSREIAVRRALGAARARLVRLVLVETMMLGLCGAAFALIFATWAAELAVPLLSRFGEPVTLDVPIDWRLFLFVTGIALVTAVASSIAPIFGVLRTDPAVVLAESSRTSTAHGAARIRRGLVVAQFALSLALVVTAALLARTVYNLRTMSTGFDIDHVALLTVDPSAAQFPPPRAQAYLNEAVARVAQLPGVQAAGFGRIVPLGFGGSRMTITIPGYEPTAGEDMEINNNVISPSYFDATGITLASGRAFTDADGQSAAAVAIVNETMAARYWPGRSPIGQRFHLGDLKQPSVEVVGVAKDVKYRMLREASRPSFYRPLAQTRAANGVIHVRTHGDPRDMLGTLRTTVAAVDPAVPVITVRTLRDQATINLTDERLSMLIGVSLGFAALLLAAVGLYGSMSYSVSQRTRELGVRISLGATWSDIIGLVLKQALALSVAGAVLGVGVAVMLARAIESRLFGVKASDPLTMAFSIALLVVVALVASWIPARRASRIDPVHALRVE